MDVGYFFKLLLSGLTRGSIYALIALGYTMVYGIIKLINFAHGELYMLGAFTGLIIASLMSYAGINPVLSLVVATIVAIIYSSAYGVTIEKIAYKPLRKSQRLSALISAIGVSMFLQNFVLLFQTSDFLSFPNLIPDFKFLKPVENYLSSAQVLIYICTALFLLGFTLLVKFTKTGKAMRATSQDTKMAQLLGININRVISFTFLIGSAAAAIGGVLISSQMGQINFYIGFIVGIKAFVAAVLGGIGSLAGAVLGSIVLGLVESFGTGYISSNYEDLFAFVVLIVILTFKPDGLLGKSQKQKV
ncbi:branched-chain amino acid ABC transporter permease LivH [Thiospirochaeta perfilievii]|uniref:Branched-chain amino acid ABC transporter permease LivH n=1 Tax=Thiospirochaeta perfilievii TaxID=252967 RepID=A0A5C1QE76_9SPIO|nr:branched-chain amino acid ABC transporter permease LivH [Thiospirochaeta perfilievii]QEN04956.1 branched-chain amino acid ABC transporter permease LivH [Thiospirochaeta perfilievii]